MNKTEFAQKLARETSISQAKALEVVDAIFSAKSGEGIIATELDGGGKVTIPGFGTFQSKERAARQGVNPATGKPIQIAAKNVVSFKAGKTLKDRISG